MAAFTMENPVFATYVIASALMAPKVMGQGWMTVYRMLKTDAALLTRRTFSPARQTETRRLFMETSLAENRPVMTSRPPPSAASRRTATFEFRFGV